MNRCTPILLAALAAGAAPAPVAAQPLGPFQWQLAPYCNVLTLAVTGTAGAYRVEGIDDQCGTRAASVAGVASLNADGSVALGMSIVTTPGGRPVHVRATLDSATLTGTWRDSLGNSGALVPPPAGGATGNPRRQPGTDVVRAADIDPTEVQRRVSESCASGEFLRGIEETGAVSCTAAAGEPITGVRAGPGLISLRFGAEVDLRLPVDRLDNAAGFVSNVPLGTAGSNPIPGPGRIFAWYPGKAAFRVGEVDEPRSRDSSVGAYSVGLGLSPNASGSHSVALGYYSVTHRQGGIALGQSFAAGRTSVAMGQAIGGSNGAIGDSSFAAGRSTQAGGATSVALGTNVEVPFDVPGSFVFGDNHPASGSRMVGGANQFNVRADSLVTICSNPAATTCVVTGLLNPGWHSASDARLKKHFRDVDGEQVLAALALLPIREWNYKTQDDAIRHAGPTAQDFHAAFGIGETPRQISTVDADGIAMAALKAIEARTRSLAKAHRRRRRDVDALRSRLERLERQTVEVPGITAQR